MYASLSGKAPGGSAARAGQSEFIVEVNVTDLFDLMPG
jgi:hypothetical protein